MAYLNNEGGDYAPYFVQDCEGGPKLEGDYKNLYEAFSHRIVWIDGEVVPGAFQMNTAWYYAVPQRDPIFLEHCHEDTSELVGFFGSNPDDPNDLGGEIEFTLGGEAHLLTKSTIIFIPAGVPHNPMRILKVDRPIFHFSVVQGATYDGSGTYK